MQIQVSGKNLDVTNKLQSYVNDKFDRICRHFDRITSIDVTMSVEKLQQSVNANVNVPGHLFNAKASSEDMYKTIDLIADKLDRQITDHKNRIRSHDAANGHRGELEE